MNRIDVDRLWPQVQQLLCAPPAPADAELRRAARLLASSRADALELLLAQALARPGGPAAAPAAAGTATADAAEGPAVPAGGQGGQPPGLRQAALVAAGGVVGLAAGAVGATWLADALGDDGPDLG